MKLEEIRRINSNLDDDLRIAEEIFIKSATENTEEHINKYLSFPSSMNGRYISSDLFKETFPLYAKDVETRRKYIRVVHNSTAVLSNYLFIKTLRNEEIKTCIFLTGIPGGGKSFLIQSLYMYGQIPNDVMIFEGDITSPTIFEKIDRVIECGKNVNILLVNPTLELAINNIFTRREEIGRGASHETMARIMSGIPKALNDILERYKDIAIGIYDKKTNNDIKTYYGKEYLYLLENGDYDTIKRKLDMLGEKKILESEKNDESVDKPNGKR